MNIKNRGLQKCEVANELYEDKNGILNEETDIKKACDRSWKIVWLRKMGVGADVTKWF